MRKLITCSKPQHWEMLEPGFEGKSLYYKVYFPIISVPLVL